MTLRTRSGVKRSKKGPHVYKTVTRLNGKRAVSRTKTEGHWASKLDTHSRLGPPVRTPEFEGPSHFLSLLSPAAHLTEMGPVSRPLPLTSMADREMDKN